MDSLRPEVEEYYQDLGTKIVKNPDQYSTDVAKCLAYIDEHDIGKSADGPRASHRYPRDVAILGGLGGRADQAFSLLHQLYRTSQDQATDRDLYLIAPESIIFLLEKGLNSIETPTGPDLLTKYVGIIPIARPSVITTRGLEWDVVDWHTEFGTQVSTSNHIVEKLVEVQTTEKVLFTVELAGRACRES